jgi:hypothetical protein
MLSRRGQSEALTVADAFCRAARERVRERFENLFGANDPALYRLAQEVLKGEHRWLERGIVGVMPATAAAGGATAVEPVSEVVAV